MGCELRIREELSHRRLGAVNVSLQKGEMEERGGEAYSTK
jgi:hypothetical protein